MNTLLLRLVGPMQSWGYRSRFDERDTALEPTRSGVIGLIGAAMGLPRTESLEQFERLRMGVRVDAPGRVMVDYHTALNVINASGSGRSTVQSNRYYLADARFLIGLESRDLSLLEQIEAALRNPVWPLFLGRKSFVFAMPPFLSNESAIQQSIDLETSLRLEPWFKLQKWESKPDRLRLEIEFPDTQLKENELNDARGGAARGDWPVSFDFQNRQYRLRKVMTLFTEPGELSEGGLLPCIFQN